MKKHLIITGFVLFFIICTSHFFIINSIILNLISFLCAIVFFQCFFYFEYLSLKGKYIYKYLIIIFALYFSSISSIMIYNSFHENVTKENNINNLKTDLLLHGLNVGINELNISIPLCNDSGKKLNSNTIIDNGNSELFIIVLKENIYDIRNNFMPSKNDYRRMVIIDEWMRPLIVKNPGIINIKGFDIYSCGPNGIDENGGGDDIN